MKITCAWCGKEADKPVGAVNRAKAAGLRVYCDRRCAGMGRRKEKSSAQKREEKRLYDIAYREQNRDMIRAKKAEYFKRTYDPTVAAERRKQRMPQHVEYCRRPEYRTYKKQYDRRHRAKQFYGDFWECHLLAMDIRAAALEKMTDYEIRLANGTLNKALKRRREDDRLDREEPEIGPLGNLDRHQGGSDGRWPGGCRGVAGA